MSPLFHLSTYGISGHCTGFMCPAHPMNNSNSRTQLFDRGISFLPQELLYLGLFTPWSIHSPPGYQRYSGRSHMCGDILLNLEAMLKLSSSSTAASAPQPSSSLHSEMPEDYFISLRPHRLWS